MPINNLPPMLLSVVALFAALVAASRRFRCRPDRMFDRGRDVGYRRGYREGRRCARPVIVPTPQAGDIAAAN